MPELRKAPNVARLPVVEADIRFLSTADGGRRKAAVSGYRPNHLVRDDYLTSGVHDYLDVSEAKPGDTVRATITFISSEAYPGSLWIGKVINVQEGSKVVGYATITRIFNELLVGAG
jgi:translation elongation factor EF-Tu-like GTPase